jgi:hypothetical protein
LAALNDRIFVRMQKSQREKEVGDAITLSCFVHKYFFPIHETRPSLLSLSICRPAGGSELIKPRGAPETSRSANSRRRVQIQHAVLLVFGRKRRGRRVYVLI